MRRIACLGPRLTSSRFGLCLLLLICLLACLMPSPARAATPAPTQAIGLAVDPSNHTWILWNYGGGVYALWNTDPSGSLVASYPYGPYTDTAPGNPLWAATAVSVGPDGTPHLLWSNPDGNLAFWSINPSGGAAVVGSGANAGYYGVSLATGADGISRILATNSNGTAELWAVSASAAFTLVKSYGPYTDTTSGSPLWAAAAVSAGPGGAVHLLWNNPNGRVAFWDVNSDGTVPVVQSYGPYTDGSGGPLFRAAALATDAHNVSHVLWTCSDRKAILWNVNADGTFTILNTYGPFSDSLGNWSAQAIAVDPSSQTRLLWDRTDGTIATWTVSSGGAYTPVAYPAVTGLSLSPSSVVGGNSATGTVTLNAPALAGGSVVAVTYSNPSAATGPATVAVPAGQTTAPFTAPFTITTSQTATAASSVIQASYNGSSPPVTLSVTPSPATPPTIQTAASANPNPVPGKTTALSVTATDAGGESNLSYTWATTGTPPASVAFSPNTSNAAKSATATFTKAGSYTLQVKVTNAAGLTATSPVTVTVSQTPAITLTPPALSLVAGTSRAFTATAADQFGTAIAPTPTFAWSVSANAYHGSITQAGVYTAPSTAGSDVVQASALGATGTAPVTVTASAPTVVTAASANPNPVPGKTTALSVLGGDGAGESSLSYSWAATGTPPAAVAFSPNGTNAAKSATATFTQAGSYTLLVTITNAAGLTTTSPVTVTVSQTLTSIAVSPATAALHLNGTQTFAATANDQFGLALTPQPSFTWSVGGGGVGSVTSAGVYSAGGAAGTASVNAASGSVSGAASVTVTNAAPTVATAASATPNPVTGTTTALSVLGADDGGEANLTYAWAATGPATVTYSANTTNGAKNTAATFVKAGSYTLTATITDSGGLLATSSTPVIVSQTLTGIVVTPNPATLAAGGTQPFVAAGQDQFGAAFTTAPTFTWSVDSGGVGSVSSAGLYTAGATAGTATVRAASGAVSGTAAVTVTGTGAALTVTGLQIAPNPATAGGTATGTVTLSGNAPVGGTQVNLTSGNPASATVGGSVTVPAGTNTMTFPISAVAGPGSSLITAALGASSQAVTLTVNAASSAPVAYRIDAGSSTAYPDTLGNTWAAETGTFGGGSVLTTGTAIAGTPEGMLYQTQRVGSSFTYTLSAPNGNYLLALLFAEIDPTVTGPGQRVCAVTSGGQPLLTFDTFAAVGANTAVTQVVPVTVTGGSLVLTFTGGGTSNTAAVAALQLGLLPAGGGVTPFIPGLSTPVPDAPAPGWGADVIPMDGSSDSDGMGPSMGGPVNLASGVEENSPGADLWCYNPTGPGVSYERLYRSQRPNSAPGYGSPGLSPGWTDNYDLFVVPGSGTYTLHYDNDGTDVWNGTTGPLTATKVGTPYLLAQSGQAITMTAKDRSVSTFTQIGTTGGNYAQGTYLLSKMTNLVGHSVTINRDAANGYRVTSVTNDSGTALLTFAYSNGQLATVTDKDGRVITYGFSAGNLSQVSQIGTTSTAGAVRWQYGYVPSPGGFSIPALSTVQAPDPSHPGSLSQSQTSFYDKSGAVASHQDALGNVRGYFYAPKSSGPVQITTVTVTNAAALGGGVAQTWQHKIGPGNVDLGTIDAQKNPTTTAYYGPYLPSVMTNELSQTATAAYDPYGNPTVVTSPRGVQISTTFSNPGDFALGQPTQVQRSHFNAATMATDSTLTATQISYFNGTPGATNPGGAFNGLVSQTLSPLPDTVTAPNMTPSAPTVPTTYAYDPTLVNNLPLGNVSNVTTVGPNSVIGTPTTYSTVSYVYTNTNGTVPTPSLGEPVSVTVTGLASGGAMTTQATTFTYDSRGNTLSETDASNNTTSYAYNLADQMTSVIYPATGAQGSGHAHTDTTYQYLGGPASSVVVYDESGTAVREVDTLYDAEGQAASVTGSTQPAAYAYDGRGRVVQMADGNNNKTTYAYDTLGNLSAVYYPGWPGIPSIADTEFYGYDAAHNRTSKQDGRGVKTAYARVDPESLVTNVSYSAVTGVTPINPVSLTYDPYYGRRAGMTDGTGTATYGPYDDMDSLLSMSKSFTGGPQGQTLAYAHNPDGSRLSMTTPGGVSNPLTLNGGKFGYTYEAWGGWLRRSSPGRTASGNTPISATAGSRPRPARSATIRSC